MSRLSAGLPVALFLALAIASSDLNGRPAGAEIFVIPDGDTSALVAAIATANTNGENDEIVLATNGTYIVDSISSSLGGGVAFPLIEPDGWTTLEIWGNGATILRAPLASPMRFFYVLEGGSLYLYDIVLQGGLLSSPFEGGGAIRVRPDASATIERTVLRDNVSPVGSAVHADGYLSITDSEIKGNLSKGSTAAVVANHLAVRNSTVRNNDGAESGAILTLGSAQITNTTIADNEGFGIHMPDTKAATYLTILNATIHGNSGAGIILDSMDGALPLVKIDNIVLAQNAHNCAIDLPVLGANIVVDDASCPEDDIFRIVDDVILSPLSDNGGATLPGNSSPWSMAPLTGSPLIDTGDDESCFNLYWDQLGQIRPVDGNGDGVAACDAGAVEYQPFRPTGLEVDSMPFDSDGNGVFEPGESIAVVPSWEYDASPLQNEVLGEASAFEGPLSAVYALLESVADYGVPGPGEPFTCERSDSEGCYTVSIRQFDVRPAQHWDATLRETFYKPEMAASHLWTLHVGNSFDDLPPTSPFYRFVETLLHHEVTSGCSATGYCPAASTTRRQMPVFVLRALESANYSPPACKTGSERFSDVPASSPFCPWIEELVSREVIVGCGDRAYCPSAPVSRAQMAIFALRSFEGGAYEPPLCESGSEMFKDVPAASPFCPWIEELARRQVVAGCGADSYCPAKPVTRGEMSVFVSKTFALSLYGP